MINHNDLRRRIETDGERKTIAHLREALEQKHLKPSDFSIRRLAEALVPDGREWVDRLSPNKSGGFASLQEAGAVQSATFSNITGQIVYSALIESFQDEEFVFTKLIPTTPTAFNGEKIAGMGRMGDGAELVDEAQPYPRLGFTEDYIETPQTKKRGNIVEVTKEAVFFDRTGLVLERAKEVGHWLGVNKEKRAIDCIIDENTTAHRYRWKGTTYATYQSSSPWDNVTASNALADYSDIDNAEQTLNGILDPHTGEPVMVTADSLIVVKALEWTAHRIANSTEYRLGDGAGSTIATIGPNPAKGKFNVITSRLLASRLATDTDWFYGSPTKLARWMENFPMRVDQAPPNNQSEFERDIVAQYKASERGAFAVVEPRVMSKCTVA